MKTIAIVSLLLCALFAFTLADQQATQASNIELDVFQGSNAWWLAIAVSNGDVDTQTIQIKDSKSSASWESMTYTDGWGYWTYTSQNEAFEFPVSLLLTGENGEQVTLTNAISSAEAATVDTAVQYGSSVAPASAPTTRPSHTKATKAPKPTKAPTAAPTNKHTKAPTAAPTSEHTQKPTAAPTTSTKHTTAPTSHTSAPTTTKATTTKAATTKPTTAPTSHTSAPTTKAATSGSSSGSSSGSGCSGGMKLLVPLYVDPGTAWNTVAASGGVVGTVAIINPDSGPGSGPDSTYTSGMNTLNAAGVEMVGYVHTSYGARAIADVKADIDVYASQFPLLVGIFVDEVATSSSEVSYYQEVYSYIMSFPGWKYDILNPGAVPSSGYAAIATQIVTYEDTSSGFANSENPSGVSCSNKNEYAVITYAASDASAMETVINAAASKGYYGWVYATSGTASGNTYGSLPSYYAQMASYIASLN